MLIRVGQLTLTFDPPVSYSSSQFRGAIAATWPEQNLLHQHKNGGDSGRQVSATCKGLNYIYPRVRYGIRDNFSGVITGIEEGVPILEELGRRLNQLKLRLGLMETRVAESILETMQSNFGFSDEGAKWNLFEFLTPWLALNEDNYARYQVSGPADRLRLLERILIGNILSMSKGLGYVVTEEIKVSQLDVYPVRTPVRLKGVEMTGFKGTFAVNFELPDLLGLGKSVSRGFGTVRRLREGSFSEGEKP
jgi:hypothetical protein